MKGVTVEENTIDRLLTLGTITYESSGWGTGEVVIKCRSNTKCEQESLNKAVISFKVSEKDIEQEQVEEFVVRELGKKLEAKEVKVLSEADKKYDIAKRKFKVWKNTYKSEHQSNE